MAITCKGSVVVGTRINPFFMLLVKTDNAGTSASNQFTIPTSGGGYNYDVDWGDGTTDTGLTGTITHTFAGGAGTYIIKISGDFRGIYFNGGGDGDKVLEIQNWGNIAWNVPANTNGAFRDSFEGCSNLEITATDSPDLSAVTTMFYMFNGATNMVGNSSLNNWDVSNVNNFLGTFQSCIVFNSPLSNWIFPNANTNLQQMFQNAFVFNQDIGNWDVQNVTSMNSLFRNAYAFNNGGSASIGNWNTSNVTDFRNLFLQANAFNQDVGNWDFSNATGGQGNIFEFATVFNQYLGNWQLNTALTSLAFMFRSSGMSTENYTDTLVAWANQVITNGGPFNLNFGGQVGRTFDTSRSGGTNFADAGAARTYLTTATPTGAGWTISSDTVI